MLVKVKLKRGGRDRKDAEVTIRELDCCKPLSFSTRRRPAPYSSFPSDLPKWRPESRSTPSNQLASLVAFHPTQVVSCNFPSSWQGQAPGFPCRCLQISIVCPGYIAYNSSAHTYFMPCSRGMSTQPPAEKASEIINKLPSSPNLVTKTGTVILGSGLAATAISQELYVMNEETVIAVGFFLLLTFIAKARFELTCYWTPASY